MESDNRLLQKKFIVYKILLLTIYLQEEWSSSDDAHIDDKTTINKEESNLYSRW